MSSNLFEIVDLYSEPVNFTYKKKYYHMTACGGVISIIVVLIISCYLAYLLYHMFKRSEPYLLRVDTYYDIPYAIYVWKDKSYDDLSLERDWIPEQQIHEIAYWYTSIGIRNNVGSNPYLISIDPSYMSLEVHQKKVSNGTVIEIPLNYLKCPKFGRFEKSQYESLLLNETYCINDNFTLKGTPGKEGSAWVELKISMCNGLPICKSEADILSTISNIQIEFYFQSRLMNTTSFGDDLISSSIEQLYWDLIPTYTKHSVCEIGIDHIKSYDSYLPDFIDGRYVNSYAFMVRSNKDYLSDINAQKNLLNFKFQASHSQVEIQRRFPDLLFQLAMVGGIAGIIYSLGYLASFLCAKFRLYESLINDFYNVIPPKNNIHIKTTFTQFLKEQYNYLMNRYYESIKIFKKNDVKLDPSLKDNKGMIVENHKNNNEIPKEVIISSDNFSLMESKIEKSNQEEILIEKIFNVIDDEGLMKKKSPNALELYFTLKRIESIYNITKEQRDKWINEIDSQNLENFDFYEQFLSKRDKTDLYEVEQAVYKVFIYTCYDKIYFSTFEMFKKTCCGCCLRKKKKLKVVNDGFKESKKELNANLILNVENDKYYQTNGDDVNMSSAVKKFKIYEGSILKLGMDFDIISVLKTVENLETFKNVFFDSSERGIFESVANPAIKVTDANEELSNELKNEEERDQYNLNEFRHFILNIFSKGKLSVIDKNMLTNMGMDNDDVKKISTMVGESKIKNGFESKDDFNSNVNDKLREKSESEGENKNNNDEPETEELPNLGNSEELYREINEKFAYNPNNT